MVRNIKYIGESGNDLIAAVLTKGKRVFTFKEASQIFGARPNLRQILSSLVQSGWLKRLEKGKYLIVPLEAGSTDEWTESEFVIASYLIQPYYIGLQSALNYYAYSEKVSKTVYVVSTRQKLKASLSISGVEYRFVTINQARFFGFAPVKVDNQEVNLSDREKTIVDCLYLQEYGGGIPAVAQAIWYGRRDLDFKKLSQYAISYRNKAICQRLGYLYESLNVKDARSLDNLQKNISSSYARLDTLLPPTGKFISKWKLQINVQEGELQQWRLD